LHEYIITSADGASLPVYSDWCVVQSDNRNNDMVSYSFNSGYKQSFLHNYTHLAYRCFGKGPGKPTIILEACNQCKNIIWVDSDAFLTDRFNLVDISNFVKAYPKVSMMLGTDFIETNKLILNNKKFYVNYFNNGLFYFQCRAKHLMHQWKSYTINGNFKSDQEALQWMAMPNSIFHNEIKYDFEYFGVHSKQFKHFPGDFRSKFPQKKTALVAKTLECPF